MKSDSSRDQDLLKLARECSKFVNQVTKPYVHSMYLYKYKYIQIPKHQNNQTGANNLEIEFTQKASYTIKSSSIVEEPFRSHHRQFVPQLFSKREKESLIDLSKRERGGERERKRKEESGRESNNLLLIMTVVIQKGGMHAMESHFHTHALWSKDIYLPKAGSSVMVIKLLKGIE